MGNKWTGIGPVNIWTWFHPLVVCFRKNIQTFQYGPGLGCGATGLNWVPHFIR